ncbi:MAG: hypothetical protein F6J93_34610 [Oscillatoria sp. SIO1A7]|nr:hypothetical protein [Oscillatoria sp. SIO1A7]
MRQASHRRTEPELPHSLDRDRCPGDRSLIGAVANDRAHAPTRLFAPGKKLGGGSTRVLILRLFHLVTSLESCRRSHPETLLPVRISASSK